MDYFDWNADEMGVNDVTKIMKVDLDTSMRFIYVLRNWKSMLIMVCKMVLRRLQFSVSHSPWMEWKMEYSGFQFS